MKVELVETEHGSRIEPRCNDWWSDLKKLEWKAAVIEATTGLKVEIHDAKTSTKVAGIWVRDWSRRYGFMVQGGVSIGSFSFSSAWTFLNGLEIGYESGKKAVRS